MELDEQNDTKGSPESVGNSSRRRPMKIILDVVIVVFLLMLGYFSYAFMARNTVTPIVEKEHPKAPQRAIQLDVLNGCGARGAAARFTTFLRSAGFDVVEMKNYKVSTVPRTLVVDRIGDLAASRRVAAALGIAEKNIIQQINSDYFVDVSVIIGGDYSLLQPSH